MFPSGLPVEPGDDLWNAPALLRIRCSSCLSMPAGTLRQSVPVARPGMAIAHCLPSEDHRPRILTSGFHRCLVETVVPPTISPHYPTHVTCHGPPILRALGRVPDHLQTPTPGSFSQAVARQDACALAQPCARHSPPRQGRWLQMAAIERSALARPCLDRRLGDLETFNKAVASWTDQRHHARTTVQWKLTTTEARQQLKRTYPMLQDSFERALASLAPACAALARSLKGRLPLPERVAAPRLRRRCESRRSTRQESSRLPFWLIACRLDITTSGGGRLTPDVTRVS
jgi:hypothetical protein